MSSFSMRLPSSEVMVISTVAAPSQEISLRCVVDFDLVRVGKAEVEKLLVSEVIEILTEFLSEVAGDLVHPFDDARFRIVIIFVLANPHLLRAGLGRDLCGRDHGTGCKRLFRILIR